jgi:protein gp37
MRAMTDIEWTDESWNPIVGCSVTSPGCTNCYAMRKAWRLASMGRGTAHYRGLTEKVNGKIVWTGAMRAAPQSLFQKPLRWKKPKKIFVNSMGDLFHEAIPDALIDRVFAVMALCPQHTFQILTKRAKRMRDYVKSNRCDFMNMEAGQIMHWDEMPKADWPLKNVWLGVSAEDQKRAEERIPILLDTPAAKRFVSCEPLLGEIDLTQLEKERDTYNTMDGIVLQMNGNQPYQIIGTALDWVIAGGESGPGARPPHPDWFRSLRDQCAEASVPYFFKQWGSFKETFHDQCDGVPKEKLKIVSQFNGGDIANDALMQLVGKPNAGRTLDGKIHAETPA